jgi:RNA polymerase sigma factor (sigma-70 family)
MSSDRDAAMSPPHAGAQFTTTHWSVILAAGHDSSPGAHEALEQLCRTYWYPLYAYLRRRGLAEHDAQDVTQGFLTQLLERDSLKFVSQERGKFRSFLLASLNFFLADQRDKAGAGKRGGGLPVISLDGLEAEDRYRLEPSDEQDPERIFERRWALTVLDQVMDRLHAEYQHADKDRLFEHLQPFLLGERSHATYREVGAKLGLSEGAVKMAILRMRQSYRDLFRQVIAETVADRAKVDEELRFLFSVIAR